MNTKSHISNSLYLNLLNNLNGVFYRCKNDNDWTIEYVTDGCENLTGYKSSDLINNKVVSYGSLVHPDDQLWLNEKCNHNLNNKLQCNNKYRIIDKSGKTKWVNEIANGVYNEKGELLFIEGYIQDVSAQQEISTISNAFTSLQNAINQTSIVSITDKAGKIIFANEKFCFHSQYNSNELIGKNHRIINSGIHDKSFFKDLWDNISKGNTWRGEICNRAKDGSIYWVDTVITPVLNAKKQTEQYLSIRNIITDKKKIEIALSKSEERLRKVFEGVNDVIYTLSQEGKFVSINKAFEKLTGWKVQDFIGKSFIELIHTDDLHITLNSFQKAITGIPAETFEVRIKTRSGKYLYAEITPSGLIEYEGVLSTLGVARDVSFRKETELKLKHIFDTVSVKTGMTYFSNLTKYCCENLQIKYACIGIYLPEQKAIQTISFRSTNQVFENFTYLLENTPCEKVINMEGFNFLNNVQAKFPKDEELKILGIESYMGYPLMNDNNEVLGIITLMNDTPIKDNQEIENLLSFILARTANEISRNLTLKKLQESEEFNKGVLSSLTSHIAVVNKTGEIISVNNAWDKFAKENEVTNTAMVGIGANYFDVCEKAIIEGDKHAKEALKGILSVLNNEKESFQMEYPCNSPTIERWFLLSVTKYESNDPKVVIRHVDITQRKDIEKKLEKNEKNYRELVENSQEIIFSVDAEGKFIFTNKFCQSKLKYSAAELLKTNLFDIIKEDQHGVCTQHFAEVIKGSKKTSTETIFVSKNGKNIYVEGDSTPIFLEGKIIGIQSFFRDISERKKAKVELQKSEQRYKNVVENINDAIIVRNLRGRIEYANQRFLELLGLKKEDLIGLSMEDYIAPGWQAEIRKQYANIIKGKLEPEIYEYQGLHNNGTTRWLEDKITLLYEEGKVIGTQAVIRDITEVKRKEQELKKLISELTNRNNEMMQFNYIVSHNLRAPIANVIGLSSLITNENIDQKEGKKIIDHIKSSSLKMDEMIKDLSLVLNTKTNLNTKKEKVFLHNIIHGISEMLEDQISKSKCILTIDIAPNANTLFTIKSYIESILFNLISNAIKYRSSERQLNILIKTVSDDHKTTITISDNGIGIDMNENGAYVFGLYKRFNYEVEGKGLGLHMTKTQVEALGGKISIESEPDRGTTFKVELFS